jgi:hypothetical protein
MDELFSLRKAHPKARSYLPKTFNKAVAIGLARTTQPGPADTARRSPIKRKNRLQRNQTWVTSNLKLHIEDVFKSEHPRFCFSSGELKFERAFYAQPSELGYGIERSDVESKAVLHVPRFMKTLFEESAQSSLSGGSS